MKRKYFLFFIAVDWCIVCSRITYIVDQHALKHEAKFNFAIFRKENQIYGFPCCNTREDLSIDVSFTTARQYD